MDYRTIWAGAGTWSVSCLPSNTISPHTVVEPDIEEEGRLCSCLLSRYSEGEAVLFMSNDVVFEDGSEIVVEVRCKMHWFHKKAKKLPAWEKNALSRLLRGGVRGGGDRIGSCFRYNDHIQLQAHTSSTASPKQNTLVKCTPTP